MKRKFYPSRYLLIPLLLLSLMTVGQNSPPVSVSGTVKDEKGELIVGSNISIKGTVRGTATDANGKFKIDVPNSASVLIFSYVGFGSKEITVGNQTSLNMVLISNESILDEVVVIGYGTQKI